MNALDGGSRHTPPTALSADAAAPGGASFPAAGRKGPAPVSEGHSSEGSKRPFDVEAIRAEFPILAQQVNGHPLAYLDNGATTQKPARVIDVIRHHYESDNANIHRGLHALSERSTRGCEEAREKIRSFINASDHREIIFLRGTTEALNLVAQSHARPRLRPDDEILITTLEHHSNIVPWQLVCRQTGASLKVVPIHDNGELDLEAFKGMLGPRTRILALAHVSNALGTINPVAEIVAMAREQGAVTVLDGAQAVAHGTVDVQKLGCDFYAFSGHKLYGPTGIGVLYGRKELLQEMEPWQGGGDMIRTVSFEESTWNEPPYRFEAGTSNIAGIIGLGAAIEFMASLDMDAIVAHEKDLLSYATEALESLSNIRIIGTARHKAGLISFVMEGVHPHDIGTIADQYGVAIRAGHHCAMPLMKRYRVPATSRASFALYNNRADIDALMTGLHRTKEIFRL
ncbi:MAG: cysteine desulfurase [Ectothiorhodospiraceae bacterium AqS1]|nr:cysteine desulfurase [Ectothiorhodospiraceae bacterium AqS1]